VGVRGSQRECRRAGIHRDNTQALQGDPDRGRSILDRIPAARWAAASDLAGAVVSLASPASGYVSGITLPVDGGWLGR
jgi:2-deoxy-D-gluconate 3-dehydrogenase